MGYFQKCVVITTGNAHFPHKTNQNGPVFRNNFYKSRSIIDTSDKVLHIFMFVKMFTTNNVLALVKLILGRKIRPTQIKQMS